MGCRGIVARLLLLVGVLMAVTVPVSAETISVSKTITVKAKVLPAQYILVDKDKNIIEVRSNSKEPVIPLVYMSKITKENELPLTKAIYARYNQLVSAEQLKPGIIYNKGDNVNTKPLTFSLALK